MGTQKPTNNSQFELFVHSVIYHLKKLYDKYPDKRVEIGSLMHKTVQQIDKSGKSVTKILSDLENEITDFTFEKLQCITQIDDVKNLTMFLTKV